MFFFVSWIIVKQSEHHRFYSFCPRGLYRLPRVCAVVLHLFCLRVWTFIVALMNLWACIDRMWREWHLLFTRGQHNLSVQTQSCTDTALHRMCHEIKVHRAYHRQIQCVCMCMHTGWQVADRQRVQQQVMSLGSRFILFLALSSYRSPSILFSPCQKPTALYWLELIAYHFHPAARKSQNSVAAGRWNRFTCLQNKLLTHARSILFLFEVTVNL